MRSCHSTNTAAQARRLCYFSLGFRHPGGAARSRAHSIIGVPPVFPIRAKGYKSQVNSRLEFEASASFLPSNPEIVHGKFGLR